MAGKKIGLKFAGAALLAAFSLVAQAGDSELRSYVSPMAGYFFADDDRRADDGAGGALAFGIEASDLFNIELELSGDGLDKDQSAGGVEDFKQFGAGINALVVLARNSMVSPYLLVGAGMLNDNASSDESPSTMGQAGLGAFVNLGDNFALRMDGRYRLDSNDGDIYSQSKFEDFVAMLGFVWRFGGEAAPVEAAALVAAAVAAPADSDNDGVTDDLDKCPGTPAGAKVDATGCELDSDNDGVADSKDRCPDTKPGMKVDDAGCDLDSDGDGVTDDKDLCPDTPAGTKVNATGCAEEVGFVIKGINFATGSAKLTPESTAILDRVAEKLLANPGIKITVDGHTDSTGSKAGNTRLSKARAQAVVDYFVGKGISADNLVARGFGPDRPVADNKTAAGRAQNRRVEINTVN